MRMRRQNWKASCLSVPDWTADAPCDPFVPPVQCPVMEPTTTSKTRRLEVRLSDEERELDAAAA
jgi:hypothetical protein